jgi:hypothetical protein
MKALCRALLALDVAWCVTALLVPGLPGWKMFDSPQGEPFTIIDGDGRPIDARDWLPRGAAGVDGTDATRIARWLCREHRAKVPLRVDAATLHRVIDAPECAAHAP